MKLLPPRASNRQVGANRAAIWVTMLAWATYTMRSVKVQLVDQPATTRTIAEMLLYFVVITALTGSAVAYLVARHGFLARSQHHVRAPRAALDEHFADTSPSLVVLVPSYREESRVVRQTLLSASLQEYDDISIVLLVDDPAHPRDDESRLLLEEALALPGQVEAMLAGPAAAARTSLAGFDQRRGPDEFADSNDLTMLAADYRDAAQSLDDITAALPRIDHTDDFLAHKVIGRLASEFRAVADALLIAADDHTSLTAQRVRQLHLRLVRVFSVRLSAFQRKRFASLSHEPNKAMNLNSYISLMGNSYAEVHRNGGTWLELCDEADADLVVSGPDYLLTLDADSVLLPEYCLRLVQLMEQPGNERLAVTQTPYSAFPGAPTRLERLSGATTDLQHRVHQGLTFFGATFWVGANAIIRRTALDDIATVEMEAGRPMVRYIHDRTVIEDTESSIDLGAHEWELYNYGERLSYSATPPDFGSLAIQRQRWADGGLIILPKLLRTVRAKRRAGTSMKFAETFLRVNYLASIAWSSIGLLLLLGYPFAQTLMSPLVILAAAPYFLAQASDLAACGYKRRDAVRIYGFNLLLLPVNLAGALRSIGQGVTGNKIAFARTPKRQNRTATRGLFVFAPLLLAGFSSYTAYHDIIHQQFWHAAFATLNASTCLWAIVALIGVRAAITDLAASVINFVYHVPKPTHTSETPTLDWATVLDQGVS
ncbi:MAG: glycosyltransferase family 2 protein [Actinomycetota bacterium]